VGFGSKERPRNGIFGVFSARKMGREPKKRRRGTGEGRKETFADKLLDNDNWVSSLPRDWLG